MYSLVCVFLFLLASQANSAVERLSCSVINLYTVPRTGTHGIFLNGTLHIQYDRDELAITKYDNTNYVNFLIWDTKIIFEGKVLDDYKKKVDPAPIFTHLEGIARLKKNKNDTYSLTDCVYDLKKYAAASLPLPESVQYGILNFAQTCVHTQLCSRFGVARDFDFTHGVDVNHNYGDNSALYDALGERYPNLPLPNPRNKSESGLQTTLNLFSDFWLASAAKRVSENHDGSFVLPNIDETIPGMKLFTGGYFHLYKGTFSDLRQLKRVRDINVTFSGLEFIAEAEYYLPGALIHYNEYAFKSGLATADGQLDISIDNLRFNIRVSMNYNQDPCRVTVTEITSEYGDFDFTLSQGNLLDKIFNELASPLIANYTELIVGYVKSKIDFIISEPLDDFDCEAYRP